MLITKGRIRTLIIYGVLIGLFLTVVSGIISIRIPTERTAAVFAFFALLLAMITLPPIEEAVEQTLSRHSRGVDAVREQLKHHRVEQFLQAEIRDMPQPTSNAPDVIYRYLNKDKDPTDFPLKIPLHVYTHRHYKYNKPRSAIESDRVVNSGLDYGNMIGGGGGGIMPPGDNVNEIDITELNIDGDDSIASVETDTDGEGGEDNNPPHIFVMPPFFPPDDTNEDYEIETDIKRIYEHMIASMQIPVEASIDPDQQWRDCMVIEGERGSGRTTKLLEMARYLLNERDTTRVPIYLNLFSWQSDSRSFEAWLIDELTRQYELPAWEARQLVRTNYLILLLDDFEDVDYKHRRHLITAMVKFLQYRKAGRYPRRHDTEKPALQGILRDAVIVCTEQVTELRQKQLKQHPPQWRTSTRNYAARPLRKDPNYRVYSQWKRDYYLNMHNQELVEQLEAACLVRIQKFDLLEVERYIDHLPDLNRYHPMIHSMLPAMCTPFYLHAALATYKQPQPPEQDGLDNWHHQIKANTQNFPGTNTLLPWQQSDEWWEDHIEEDYATGLIWRLPDSPGPFERDPFADTGKDERVELQRSSVIEWLARTMKRQNQTLIRRRDALFYLEDRMFRLPRPLPGKKPQLLDEPSRKKKDRSPLPEDYSMQFKGTVAAITALLFLAVYLVFVFFMPRDALQLWVEVTCGVLIVIYGRNFGWHSCTSPHFTLSYDSYVGLNWKSALVSGVFMSVIVALLFYDVSCALYLPRDNVCLSYESTVYGVYAFMLFIILGGLEIGRRNEVFTRPNELVQHIATVFLFAMVGWVLFFLLFILWPRTLVQTPEDIRALARDGFLFALYSGVFLSIISSLTLVHSLLRYAIMLWFLGNKMNYRVRFTQYLEQFVSINLMRRVDRYYVFRSRRLLEYFAEDDFDRARH